jgi:hypothetical protein
VLVPLHHLLAPHVPESSLQVMLVPPQPPAPLHLSLYVQALLSLHSVPVPGKLTVQVLVPLQDLLAPHVAESSLHEMLVPPQEPPPLHLSLYVQLLLSLQPVPVPG